MKAGADTQVSVRGVRGSAREKKTFLDKLCTDFILCTSRGLGAARCREWKRELVSSSRPRIIADDRR